jgi:hypothetical protein
MEKCSIASGCMVCLYPAAGACAAEACAAGPSYLVSVVTAEGCCYPSLPRNPVTCLKQQSGWCLRQRTGRGCRDGGNNVVEECIAATTAVQVLTRFTCVSLVFAVILVIAAGSLCCQLHYFE